MSSPSKQQRDFSLCQATYKWIASKYDEAPDIWEYSEFERVVMLVWNAKGIIENGGFELLFSWDTPGDSTYQVTASMFDVIGCHKAVNAFDTVMAALSELSTTGDINVHDFSEIPHNERLRMNREFWSASDNMKLDDDVSRCLARYIREHWNELGLNQ